jgi:hypothetical protein
VVRWRLGTAAPRGLDQATPAREAQILDGLVALVALGVAARAAWLAWTGQPAAGVPLAAGAIFLGHVVGLSTRVWWTRPRSSRTGTLTAMPAGTKGVTFTYSAWSYYWLTAVVVMSELVAVALTVALALSATVVGVVLAVVTGGLAMVVGWGLVTMIGLAVGIDYWLFTVSRYRKERARGRDQLAAIGAAGGTANRAGLFSG